MSGTSLDGVDAALIETDGYGYAKSLGFVSIPYEQELRSQVQICFGKRSYDPEVERVERLLTAKHAEAVKALGERADIIGFHGQTLTHDPGRGLTFQIGDGAMLARETGMDVVCDFRSADVAAGGEGAPLLPLYHKAKAAGLPKPVCILNIGGVANVTWIGEEDILAFDTGPGNALMDDWVQHHTDLDFDMDGNMAASGEADEEILQELLAHHYFELKPPKSLDRNEFSPKGDITTLALFTVRAVEQSLPWLPQKPKEWLVTGGGRHNKFIMRELQKVLGTPVKPVEDYGWNGDALEAEGFAYLAVRSLLGEALSLPSTTGVPAPQTGGVLHKASS
ncbi:MAG: anhydro-N-acetylmuramic acid kinase [Alphaproteobacteria bacterium]|nr:anhydro-N-acetylmuramic acid kinase [Alphaproteobacteria bacterium]